jgi:hypothetical protein
MTDPTAHTPGLSWSDATNPRIVSLVITDDAPLTLLREFLNALDEDKERDLLAFIASPDFPLFVACREIEMRDGEE